MLNEKIALALENLSSELLATDQVDSGVVLCWRGLGRLRASLVNEERPILGLLFKRVASALSYRSGQPEPLSEEEFGLLASWLSACAQAVQERASDEGWEMLVELISTIDPESFEQSPDIQSLAGGIANELQSASCPDTSLDDRFARDEKAGSSETPHPRSEDLIGTPAIGAESDDSIQLGTSDTEALVLEELIGQFQCSEIAGTHLFGHEPDSQNGSHEGCQPPLSDSTDVGGTVLPKDNDFEPRYLGDSSNGSLESESFIWLASDETELVCTAIQEQVRPLLAQVSDCTVLERNEHLDNLAYQCSLISNAFGHIGLRCLASAISQFDSSHAIDSIGPDVVDQTMADLERFLVADCAFALERLKARLTDIVVLEQSALDELVNELDRVRRGVEPSDIQSTPRQLSRKDVSLEFSPEALPNVVTSMLRELPKNVVGLGEALRDWLDGDLERLTEACRVAHTLKGDANTVGVVGLANITHELETLLLEHQDERAMTEDDRDLFMATADTIEEISDYLCGHSALPQDVFDLYVRLVIRGRGKEAEIAPDSLPELTKEVAPDDSCSQLIDDKSIATFDQQPAAGATTDRKSLSVEVDLLDEVQRLIGESSVLLRQIDSRVDLISSARKDLSGEIALESGLLERLDELVSVQGAALGSASISAESQIDPLELDNYTELHALSRRLMESRLDKLTFLRRLNSALLDLEGVRSQTKSTLEELYKAGQQTTSIYFSTIVPRLMRTVRQAARATGKQVKLSVEGDGVQIEAALLERLVEPLSHLLRNSVDHGIDLPTARSAIGKAACGSISIEVAVTGDRLNLRLCDDGEGLDVDRILEKAKEAGLERVLNMPVEGLHELVFLHGFSTRDSASQVSGRGLGLDIVRKRIHALGGDIRIESSSREGLHWLVSLPISQSQANVLFFHGPGFETAATVSSIEAIVEIDRRTIRRDEAGQLWTGDADSESRVTTIEHLFKESSASSAGLNLSGKSGMLKALCVPDGAGNRWSVVVSDIGEARAAMIRPLAPWIPEVAALRGITQLANGEFVSVVDLAQLIKLCSAGQNSHAEDLVIRQADPESVIVADDSLSVRRALQQLLEDAGFPVQTARDGLEVLTLMQQQRPAALVLDFEMPRMNGLEVAKHVRSEPEYSGLPIVIISSRSANRYERLLEEAQIDSWISKPYTDDQVIDVITGLMARQA